MQKQMYESKKVSVFFQSKNRSNESFKTRVLLQRVISLFLLFPISLLLWSFLVHLYSPIRYGCVYAFSRSVLLYLIIYSFNTHLDYRYKFQTCICHYTSCLSVYLVFSICFSISAVGYCSYFYILLSMSHLDLVYFICFSFSST